VFDLSNTQISKIKLPEFIFGVKVRPDLLHRMVRWQRNKKRLGLAKGKTRSEVKGSSRKMYQQKGTGRARASTIRNPIRKGGGKAHPPRGPRDYSFKVNKKVRRLALKSALAIKFAKKQVLSYLVSLKLFVLTGACLSSCTYWTRLPLEHQRQNNLRK